jgi:hypothetical protein
LENKNIKRGYRKKARETLKSLYIILQKLEDIATIIEELKKEKSIDNQCLTPLN